jgi:cell wall-associated NlpC family hydrolase
MTRHWSAAYLGLDFPGDPRPCWALVRQVFRAERGLILPAYQGGREDPTAPLAWTTVEGVPAREFDLATFRFNGIEDHVGVVIEGGLMLHVAHGITSRLERLASDRWAPLFVRFVRHTAVPA